MGARWTRQPPVAAVPHLVQEWSPLNSLTPQQVTLGSSRRVMWVCARCSHHWQAVVSNRFYRKANCPACAQTDRQRPRGKHTALELAPRLAAEWVPELNPGVDLTRLAPSSKTMVRWRCPDCGHEWVSRLATRVRTHSGCPPCSNARRRGRRIRRTAPEPSAKGHLPVYDSVTTWRMYSAEQSIALGEPLPDIEAARTFLRKVRSSAWWRDTIPYRVRVSTVLGGREGADGSIMSFARATRPGRGPQTSWTISMHPGMLNDIVVLHELAHCVAPRMGLGEPRWRPGQLHGHTELPVHGAGFTGILAELVGQFASGAHHSELRSAYEHFEVPALTLPEYCQAVTESLLAEEDHLQLMEEVDHRWGSGPGSTNVPASGGIVPEFTWGDQLRWLRVNQRDENGRLRTVSKTALADRISQVQHCRVRDLTELEGALQPPADPRLRKIAMCTVVELGIDPIYARHQLGLVRWECGVQLEELEMLNPGWVAMVRKMNLQLSERPPRWVVQGDR